MTLVRVVVPTRNRLALLRRTLTSVLGQAGLDRDDRLEVVVVDEASGDGTTDWLAGWGDDRVRVVRHDTPRGVARARNAGIAAPGIPDAPDASWVAFCDDDDLWAPGKLAAQLAALRAYPPARWSCVAAVVVDERLRVQHLEGPPAPSVDCEACQGPVLGAGLRGGGRARDPSFDWLARCAWCLGADLSAHAPSPPARTGWLA